MGSGSAFGKMDIRGFAPVATARLCRLVADRYQGAGKAVLACVRTQSRTPLRAQSSRYAFDVGVYSASGVSHGGRDSSNPWSNVYHQAKVAGMGNHGASG